jgi:protease-4
MSEKRISFGKIFWPSLLAGFVTSLVGILIFSLIIGGIIGSFGDFGPKPLAVKSNSILHMTLDGEIKERSDIQIDASQFKLNSSIGLCDILHGLETAKNDSKIKGLFLEIGDLQCGYATAKEIRSSLKDFQKSGKFILAYNSGELISQKEYYVSSVAKEIYGFPSSTMELIGLGTELSFFKGSLDKLDVEVQVIRGSNNDFKSAVEPFFRSNMSDSARLQINTYLTSMWEDIRNDIAADRKITTDQLNTIADSMKVKRADDAVSYKLLNGVKYRDEVISLLAKKVGVEDEEDLNLQAFEKYARKKFKQNQVLTKNDKPNIAVILAEGEVSTNGDGLSSENICKLFRDVRKNKTIKTVVFRVNSPGGSALASDEIWREVYLTNKVKKVIVSMGDVAASGGYYISAPATTIFAEPTTITGSIGVFGMIPYLGKMFESKLGMTFDRASTNAHSIMSLNRRLSADEMLFIQEEIDSIYSQFLGRVAEGRKMSKEQVNVVARGRVWTGIDAKEIGLVDKLGGLRDAIDYAAKRSNIKDQRVLYYPLNKDDKFMELLEEFEDDEDGSGLIGSRTELPEELVLYYNELKKLESRTGIQMRLPFDLNIR